jgi:hypothetical protein
MTPVSRKEGFRYGFYVFAYWLVLLVFSVALVAAGGYIVEMQNLGDPGLNEDTALAVLGGFVALLGVLVFGSGQVGLVYKLVADGVSVGRGAGDRDVSGSVTDSGRTAMGADTPTADDEATTAASAEATTATPAEATTAGTTAADQAASERAVRARQGADPEPVGERPSQPVRSGEPSPERDEATPDSEEPTTGSDEPAPRPREGGGQPRDDAESRDGTRRQSDPRAVRETGDEQQPGRPTTGSQQTGPRSEVGDENSEPAERESPEDVVSESEIAEELGFEESDERPDEPSTGDVETAETVIDSDAGETHADPGTVSEDAAAGGDDAGGESDDAGGESDDAGGESDDPGEASALDWGGSETTGGANETDAGDAGDADEPETGTGSLADALAGEDGADDDPSGGEGAPVDEDDGDEESPRWTTGDDHEGGPGQGDGQ